MSKGQTELWYTDGKQLACLSVFLCPTTCRPLLPKKTLCPQYERMWMTDMRELFVIHKKISFICAWECLQRCLCAHCAARSFMTLIWRKTRISAKLALHVDPSVQCVIYYHVIYLMVTLKRWHTEKTYSISTVSVWAKSLVSVRIIILYSTDFFKLLQPPPAFTKKPL